MKNNLITRLVALIICCLPFAQAEAQTQSVVIGTVLRGTASLTNTAGAETFLRANLPTGSTVSNVKIEYSGYDGKYYLTAKVGNSEVSSVGIALVPDGGTLLGMAGPGVEVTCTGYKCGDCSIVISHFKPHCQCKDSSPSSDARCDMISKYVLSF